MSTTDSTDRPSQYTRDQWRGVICAAIREAQADGCTDLGGGVSASELTARISGRGKAVVTERVSWLADQGVLERRSGIGHDTRRPRDSYLIADEDQEVST